jgi:hypothetical protein
MKPGSGCCGCVRGEGLAALKLGGARLPNVKNELAEDLAYLTDGAYRAAARAEPFPAFNC